MEATFNLFKSQLKHAKWYKSNEFAVKKVFRFDELKSTRDEFHYFEYFDEEQVGFKSIKKTDFFYIHDNSLFAEVTEEELEKRFFISLSWKKGDYFKVLVDKPNCSGFSLNKIYRVKEIHPNTTGLYGEKINGQKIPNSAVSFKHIRKLNSEETKELEDELKRMNNSSSSIGPIINDSLENTIFDSQRMSIDNNDNQQNIVVKNEDNIHKNITVPKIKSEKTIKVEVIKNIKI